jgi:hypothetical protein
MIPASVRMIALLLLPMPGLILINGTPEPIRNQYVYMQQVNTVFLQLIAMDVYRAIV